MTHLATYAILWTFGVGWGGDDDNEYTGTRLRFERWTKPSDPDAKLQYVCYFTYGACNGLFECDVYDYEMKFVDFELFAWDKDMAECMYTEDPLNVEFMDEVLDDQGRPMMAWFLDCGVTHGSPTWVEGWGKIHNGETEFSPAEKDRIKRYEADKDTDAHKGARRPPGPYY